MNYTDRKHQIEKCLEDMGFIKIDYNSQDQDIWRQKDDDPKMDIVVGFIKHNDNL